MRRGTRAVQQRRASRCEPIEGLFGDDGVLHPPALCLFSGCECEVQAQHALEIVGKGMPQQHRARLVQAGAWLSPGSRS
jgi:hypothetical protein